MKIKILDCTLRDGAHINGGKFGVKAKKNILKSLIDSKVDIIEVGFLQEGFYNKDITSYSKTEEFTNEIIDFSKDELPVFAFLLRAGTLNPDNLKNSTGNIAIRIAFRPDEVEEAFRAKDVLINKGYQVYFNPIGVTSYDNDYLINLLSKISTSGVKGVSIVDTYGALSLKKFKKLFEIFNNNLPKEMIIGIHLHENLMKSSALIYHSIESSIEKNRTLILDGSLSGMGRDPGNIPTELLFQIMKEYESKKYNISPLAEVLLTDLQLIKKKFSWGYDPYFFFSAYYSVDRTYAEKLKDINYETPHIVLEEISRNGDGDRFNQKILNKIINENS